MSDTNIRRGKVALAKARIAAGHYDRPEVLDQAADGLRPVLFAKPQRPHPPVDTGNHYPDLDDWANRVTLKSLGDEGSHLTGWYRRIHNWLNFLVLAMAVTLVVTTFLGLALVIVEWLRSMIART